MESLAIKYEQEINSFAKALYIVLKNRLSSRDLESEDAFVKPEETAFLPSKVSIKRRYYQNKFFCADLEKCLRHGIFSL